MKKYIIFVLLLFSSAMIHAQQSKKISVTNYRHYDPKLPDLFVGDVLPSFVIPKVINSKFPSAKSTDFKDQLLIIDFWSTGCGTCIEQLPHMQELQEKFGTKIKILPVTFQSADVILPFWKKNRYTRTLTLPSVVEDRAFRSYFKYTGVPHEVWIYKGKVVAITGHQQVTENNIQQILDGKQVQLLTKNDFLPPFDETKPLFNFNLATNPTGNGSAISYRTVSYEYIENTSPGGINIVRDSVSKTVRTYCINQSVFSSYYMLWRNLVSKTSALVKPGQQSRNEGAWEVADRRQYIYDPSYGASSDWSKAHAISFEIVDIDTGQTDQQIYYSTIRNLDAMLGLKVRWEKRKEKVLVLVKTGDINQFASKGRVIEDYAFYRKGDQFILSMGNISEVIWFMNNSSFNPYVFDETGYTGALDMELTASSWSDIPALKKSLAAYGMDLREEERLVDKLVFTEVNRGILLMENAQADAKAAK